VERCALWRTLSFRCTNAIRDNCWATMRSNSGRLKSPWPQVMQVAYPPGNTWQIRARKVFFTHVIELEEQLKIGTFWFHLCPLTADVACIAFRREFCVKFRPTSEAVSIVTASNTSCRQMGASEWQGGPRNDVTLLGRDSRHCCDSGLVNALMFVLSLVLVSEANAIDTNSRCGISSESLFKNVRSTTELFIRCNFWYEWR
jgi:hypothetical protein